MSTTTLRRTSMKRISRRRATTACSHCRKRKVRCDVTRTSQPCTNCRYDEIECIVPPRVPKPTSRGCPSTQRSPGPDKYLDDSLSLRLLEDLSKPPTLPIDHLSPGESVEISAPSTVNEASPNIQEESGSFEDSSIHSNDLSTQFSYNTTSTESDRRTSFEAAPDDDVGKVPDESIASLATNSGCWEETGSAQSPSHYDFTLDSQGCYRIPSASFLKTLIDHYFLYVHPLLPVLNEGDFWHHNSEKRHRNIEARHPNILLLQAMLFAACPFVTDQDITQLGFENYRQAKAVFYRRAKLLYHAQNPSDHVLLAQSALLLTYQGSSLGQSEQKTNSMWLSRAIQHAKVLKADKCASRSSSLGFASLQQAKRDNTLRRIWWCCIVRDRILSLCVRRELQISPDYLNRHATSTISYDDFSDEIQRSRVYDSDSKHSLITIMLLVVELCLCLSKVLTVAHSVREPAASKSRDLSRKALQIWECKKDLETWSVKAVTSSRVMAGTEPGHHRHGKPKSSILMFANLVWIYYHSARITLCSSELLLDAMSDFCIPYGYAQHQSMAVEKTHVELWDAATNITQRLGQLLKLRLAHCLPSSAVCCTALPLALHLLDARLSTTDHYKSQSKRVERQNCLNTLINAMRELHPRHEEADWITRAIRYFMECTYFEPAPSFRETNGQGPDMEDAISQNPVHYLKLALTLDLSLSQDQLPVEKDFPAKIQALIIRTGCFMPMVFSLEGEDNDDATAASPEEPPSELEHSTVLCVSPRGPDLAGWIQNDRSLFFAQEMGLGP